MAKKKTSKDIITEQTDNKKDLVVEIYNFVMSMKGKSKGTPDEIKAMFALYNKYYGTAERDYHCDLCAIRIFSKLDKIAKNYVDGKRIRRSC